MFSLPWRLRDAYRESAATFITDLQLKRAEPEQPHFPLGGGKPRRAPSGSACCVCTPRNCEVCWNQIRRVFQENEPIRRRWFRSEDGLRRRARPLQTYACARLSFSSSSPSCYLRGERRVTVLFLPYKETIMLSAWDLSLTL